MGRINQLTPTTTVTTDSVIAVDAANGGITNKLTINTLAGGLRVIGNYATQAQLAAKQDVLTFDDAPEEDSDNPVTSGGIYNAIGSAMSNVYTKAETDNAIAQSTASNWDNLASYLSSSESGANALITYAGKMRTIMFQGVSRTHAEDETLMTLPQAHRPLIQSNNYFSGNIGATSVVIAINGSTGKVTIYTLNGATSTARLYFSATYMVQ